MRKIYIDKNKVIIKDYCKHGDLEVSNGIFEKNKHRNLCIECSREIISDRLFYKEINNEFKEIKDILRDPKSKISKEKIYLWYPKAYNNINSLPGKYWREKIYLFLNNLLDTPKCHCGNDLAFNNKKNMFPLKCQSCNRSKAVSISSGRKSMEKWTSILRDYFKIENPLFENFDKYHLRILLNEKYIKIQKRSILKLKKIGILDIDNLELSGEEIKNALSEFRNYPEKYYKNISHETLKSINPIIYKAIDIVSKEKFPHIKNFSEIKFLIINNLEEPPRCSLCNEFSSFNQSTQEYNLSCESHKYQIFSSKGETELYDFLVSIYEGKIERNKRFGNTELDIYLPELLLGIEFNGLYWHSNKFKSKKYHYQKTNFFKEKGIRILHVWEDDWRIKKGIIKSILKSRLGTAENRIYARDCQVKEINYKDSKLFLESNHLQGFVPGKINLGLFYREKLVSVMTFGNRKISGCRYFELLRFSNKINYTIIGSGSKLFKYFLTKYPHFKKIVSYCNKEIFDGGIYEKLGFKYSGETAINFWWTNGSIKFHRSKFMKHLLAGEEKNSDLSAEKIMKDRGFSKIWGVGQDKWIFENIN